MNRTYPYRVGMPGMPSSITSNIHFRFWTPAHNKMTKKDLNAKHFAAFRVLTKNNIFLFYKLN